MSITITTHQREGLPTLDQLQGEWKAAGKKASELAAQVRVARNWGVEQQWLAAVDAETQAWQLYRKRMDDLKNFPIEPAVLGAVLAANPAWTLFQAEDHLFRAEQVHTYDQPVTDEELAIIFAGSEDRYAAEEWQDKMAEEVESGHVPLYVQAGDDGPDEPAHRRFSCSCGYDTSWCYSSKDAEKQLAAHLRAAGASDVQIVEEDPWGSDPRVREMAIRGEQESGAAASVEQL